MSKGMEIGERKTETGDRKAECVWQKKCTFVPPNNTSRYQPKMFLEGLP
ncbi:hypothetical protein EV194_1203 [Natronoflexus pectinivorans]|uniref:Uncharacterized protein n=1 Tax=Natronoflexus pectinivorans TaxID=682526 RepID=A0A4R2G7C0_9BACT|nr:hypothetical protein EV194_1203 [Natronoflexus pectinivorans]